MFGQDQTAAQSDIPAPVTVCQQRCKVCVDTGAHSTQVKHLVSPLQKRTVANPMFAGDHSFGNTFCLKGMFHVQTNVQSTRKFIAQSHPKGPKQILQVCNFIALTAG